MPCSAFRGQRTGWGSELSSTMEVPGIKPNDLVTRALPQNCLCSPHRCFLEMTRYQTMYPCCFLVQACASGCDFGMDDPCL